MYTYLPQVLPRDTSYSSSKEEMEVASPFQPYEGEPRTSNEDFDED